MKDVKDAESLAIDILTFTYRYQQSYSLQEFLQGTAKSSLSLEKLSARYPRIRTTGCCKSLRNCEKRIPPYPVTLQTISKVLRTMIGSVENAISLDNQLNIIQVADLVLPDKDTTFEEYTTIELLSVSILIVISTFALDFIHSDRSIFKIVDLDEAWAFLNVAQGETLSNKLVRAGRAMNAGVYFVTQSSGDVSKESLKNNIGLKFAFRSTDTNEIKQTLEFFGLDSGDENNQKRLRDLENGQCLMQDLYGRVGVVQIHPVFVELLHAFDTRPPIKSEVDLE